MFIPGVNVTSDGYEWKEVDGIHYWRIAETSDKWTLWEGDDSSSNEKSSISDTVVMGDTVFSPDGEWMWNGDSWIPAPPKSQPPLSKKKAWSAVTSDISTPQTQSPQSMNMQDSVVAGDVNITQNIGVNEDSIMSMMITELEKFDSNKSGFHIPQGGFSSSAIIAGIGELNQNISNLNRLSTEHLLEFCIALESIGYSNLLLTAAKIILERGRMEGNRTHEAKAHLLIAEGHSMAIQNIESIIHGQESANIAKEIGAIAIESEAIYSISCLLQESCKSSDYLAPRIEELLANVSALDHSDHAYLLAAKSNQVEHTNSIYCEQLEAEAYNYAKRSGDLKLQVFISMAMVGNEVHTIDKSELKELHRQCTLYNFPYYSLALDFDIKTSEEEVTLDTIVALMELMKTEGKRIDVPRLVHTGDIASILRVVDSYDGGDIKGHVSKSFEEPTFTSAIRKGVDNENFDMVDATLGLFVMVIIYFGYTNDTIRYLFNANRETMEAEVQLNIQIFSSIDRTSSFVEAQHLCRELDTDSADIADFKNDVREMMTDAPHTLWPTSTVAVDYNELALTMRRTMENRNWTGAIHACDVLLAHRNQLEFDSGNKRLVTHALEVKGVAYFKLENFQVSIPLFEEYLQRSKAEGNFDVEHIEKVLSTARNNVASTNYSSSTKHAQEEGSPNSKKFQLFMKENPDDWSDFNEVAANTNRFLKHYLHHREKSYKSFSLMSKTIWLMIGIVLVSALTNHFFVAVDVALFIVPLAIIGVCWVALLFGVLHFEDKLLNPINTKENGKRIRRCPACAKSYPKWGWRKTHKSHSKECYNDVAKFMDNTDWLPASWALPCFSMGEGGVEGGYIVLFFKVIVYPLFMPSYKDLIKSVKNQER